MTFAQVIELDDESFKRWAVTAFTSRLRADGWTGQQIFEIDLRIAHMRKHEVRARITGG